MLATPSPVSTPETLTRSHAWALWQTLPLNLAWLNLGLGARSLRRPLGALARGVQLPKCHERVWKALGLTASGFASHLLHVEKGGHRSNKTGHKLVPAEVGGRSTGLLNPILTTSRGGCPLVLVPLWAPITLYQTRSVSPAGEAAVAARLTRRCEGH